MFPFNPNKVLVDTPKPPKLNISKGNEMRVSYPKYDGTTNARNASIGGNQKRRRGVNAVISDEAYSLGSTFLCPLYLLV